MSEMTGAQALIRQLRAEGVDTVFAIPGVQLLTAFDALYELQGDIRLVQPYHEQAAAYMADGYARVTGRVGVAMVVPGPGALNTTAALGTAFASSSPVLLVAGQIPSGSLGRGEGQLHEMQEQLDVFKSITKWNHRVASTEDIPGAVHEAMRQLKIGRPRPVEIEIPLDILAATENTAIIGSEEYPRLRGSSHEIRRAANLLAEARKPVIIAGGGTIISGASQELTELAEFIQAPVITTPEAKGVISDDHYLVAGVNRFSSLSPLYSVLPDCDALLAVGTRLSINKDFKSLRVVQMDVDPSMIGLRFPVEIGIEADAKEGLAQLLEELRSIASPVESRRGEIKEHKERLTRYARGQAPEQIGIVDAIRSELDDDAIVVSGINTLGYWCDQSFPVRRPRTYVTSSYFINLGYAFPTALGAKVACPGRQVVAISGDGGFMYSPQELSTAVRLGLDVVTLVFNNSAYGAIHWNQTHRHGGRHIGSELDNPDFVKVAESFGAVGMRADLSDLGPSLRRALDMRAPVVLEVVIPLSMLPPWDPYFTAPPWVNSRSD